MNFWVEMFTNLVDDSNFCVTVDNDISDNKSKILPYSAGAVVRLTAADLDSSDSELEDQLELTVLPGASHLEPWYSQIQYEFIKHRNSYMK